MKALILIAHGSRREASNQEVTQLVNQISSKVKDVYKIVRVAFLEIAHPKIEDTVHDVYHQKVTSITLFPYFLSAGKHIEQDIPTILSKLQKNYPTIPIKLLPYLGKISHMQDLIISHVTAGNLSHDN